MIRIWIVLYFLLSVNIGYAQPIELRYLVDSSLRFRNDTANLFASWCRAGYCGGDWSYGDDSEYQALGDFDSTGQKITRYVGVFIKYGKDPYEFSNRCTYYCTADPVEYNSWPTQVKELGFSFLSSNKEPYAQDSVFQKGALFITLRRDMKKYRIWTPSTKRKNIVVQKREATDDKTPSFIAFVEVKPVIWINELFEYYTRPRDTIRLKKELFERGFSNSFKDASYYNIVGIGDQRMRNYTESLSLGLSKSNPVLIYQTTYAFVYQTWESWLLANGFTEISVAQKNHPSERYFQKGDVLAGITPLMDTESGQVYRLFIKRLQSPGATSPSKN